MAGTLLATSFPSPLRTTSPRERSRGQGEMAACFPLMWSAGDQRHCPVHPAQTHGLKARDPLSGWRSLDTSGQRQLPAAGPAPPGCGSTHRAGLRSPPSSPGPGSASKPTALRLRGLPLAEADPSKSGWHRFDDPSSLFNP